jgi:prevent-host-death family protein
MADAEVTIRDLRNHGGDVVDRVVAGEHLTLTRLGEPVAELRPLRRRPIPAAALLRRWRNLPHLDTRQLRADIDLVIDPSL